MKVLHLFSNYKWTGPAEPAVNVCLGLRERGVNAVFASGRAPAGQGNAVADQARARGLASLGSFALKKHLRAWSAAFDAHRLRGMLQEAGFDIVHAHMRTDHVVAAVAARGTGTRVVRTLYEHDPDSLAWRDRILLRSACDLLLTPSPSAARALRDNARIRCPVRHIETTVDLKRFDPQRVDTDVRAQYGAKPGDFVAGIVARVQTRRRWDVLLEAVRLARREIPGLQFWIIGQGTRRRELVDDPVRETGLGDTVRILGYLRGDDYVHAMGALDVKLFLVPGTDGSCRAVREAMAMGVPVIAARRGMLPEIVRDGVSGRVVDDTPENLARALVEMAADRFARDAMAAGARREAVERFGQEQQAKEVLAAYREILGR
jgi:glycosyltransferase involved in cell wall biosynthesis